MSFTLLQPWSAVLLLLVPVFWFLGRRASVTQRVLRCSLIGLLTLALIQPVLVHHTDQLHQVFIVDQSASVDASARNSAVKVLQQQLARAASDEQITVLQLGGEPLQLADVNVVMANDTQASLSQLVLRALSFIPHESAGHITLISDGLSSDSHWQSVISQLQLRHIVMDWWQLASAVQTPFIAKVTSQNVRMGQEVSIAVEVNGVASTHANLQLKVMRDGSVVAEKALDTVMLRQQKTQTVILSLGQAAAEFEPIELQLLQADTRVPLQQQQFILTAQQPYAVLFASADAAAGARLQQLVGPSFKVTQAPLPVAEATDFSQYQTVMLDDVRAEEFPTRAQQQLLNAVDNGGGMFYSGGETAFGKGGFAGQPLAELLPVELTQQQKQREPGVSLAIVIDSSGSMQGRPLELAKQVARLAVRKLRPQDQVGIVEFYGTRQWAVPMQSAEHPDEVERAIGRMQAQGGSELFPAIQEAYFGLKNNHNRYRHILLITDAAVEENNYQRLLRFIAQDQINVSTVLVGDGHDGEQRMADLANWGQGRFYSIQNEFNMVELNFHRPSTEPQSNYHQGQFQIEDAQTHTLLAAPSLSGYARVQAKSSSQSRWRMAESSDPLLSSWRYGAGKVAALMTEPLGAGTASWANWSGYGQWLAQQLADTVNTQQQLQLSSQRVFGQLNVRVDVADYQAIPNLEWKTDAAAEWQSQPLQAAAPGVYLASLSVANNVPVLLRSRVGQVTQRAVNQASSDIYAESKVPESQTKLLEQVVAAVGGVSTLVNSAPMPRPSAQAASARLTAFTLYPWLLLCALLLYFAEIVVRRLPKKKLLY
ncbi:VWA domain-containing protein [Shewanella sp.]|uniref:VWA domain-containing protein n=1 Tax=Shewanella sp. TaxID=50422 RepID=UPI003A96B566